MLTKIRWVLAGLLVLVGSEGLAGENEPASVVVNGVLYATQLVPTESGSAPSLWLTAVSSKESSELWRVRLGDEISTRQAVETKKPARVFAIAKGLIVEIDGRALFFVDSTTHQAEPVSDRRPGKDKRTCAIHGRPLVDFLAPIHYGLVRSPSLTKEQRDRFPLADRVIEAGCCVMPEKVALLSVCQECR